MMTQGKISRHARLGALLIATAVASVACDAGASEDAMPTLEARNAELEQRIATLEATIEQLTGGADQSMDMDMDEED